MNIVLGFNLDSKFLLLWTRWTRPSIVPSLVAPRIPPGLCLWLPDDLQDLWRPVFTSKETTVEVTMLKKTVRTRRGRRIMGRVTLLCSSCFRSKRKHEHRKKITTMTNGDTSKELFLISLVHGRHNQSTVRSLLNFNTQKKLCQSQSVCFPINLKTRNVGSVTFT